jgi:hypothetical protein
MDMVNVRISVMHGVFAINCIAFVLSFRIIMAIIKKFVSIVEQNH